MTFDQLEISTLSLSSPFPIRFRNWSDSLVVCVLHFISQNEDYILPGIVFVCSASSFDEISVLQAYFVLVSLLFLILLLLLAKEKYKPNLLQTWRFIQISQDDRRYSYIYFSGTEFWQFLNFKLYVLSKKIQVESCILIGIACEKDIFAWKLVDNFIFQWHFPISKYKAQKLNLMQFRHFQYQQR